MDLKELYAEMRKTAEANVYDVPMSEADVLAGNLVAEACHRLVEIDGTKYGIVFSLNRVTIPKKRGFLIFLPERVVTRYFWQLTISGYGVTPSDRLCRAFVEEFFIKGVEWIESTSGARMMMGKLMPKTQRQFTQMIPDTIIQ